MTPKDIRDYAENMRKFSKAQMDKSKVKTDRDYYQGRMHSAKMIRDWIVIKKDKSE